MRDESHLDDMRRAIRGDFERLAERLGGQELMQKPVEKAEEPDGPERLEEPAAQEVSETVASAETEPQAAESEPPQEETSEDDPPRRGFLARLLGM